MALAAVVLKAAPQRRTRENPRRQQAGPRLILELIRRGSGRWRRRRDSNPRYAFGAYNGLANRRLQPLGHVSGRLIDLEPQALLVKFTLGRSGSCGACCGLQEPKSPLVHRSKTGTVDSASSSTFSTDSRSIIGAHRNPIAKFFATSPGTKTGTVNRRYALNSAAIPTQRTSSPRTWAAVCIFWLSDCS